MTKGELKSVKRVLYTVVILLAIYWLGKLAKLVLEHFGLLKEVAA